MIRLLILTALLITLSGGPVVAQALCGSYVLFKAQLREKYGEARLGYGARSGAVLEVWRNETTGSWTILQVFPNGRACLKASGDAWVDDPIEPPGDPV